MAPSKIFIVPYRDRELHKQQFLNIMQNEILIDEKEPYEIYFAHQCDTRPFNRGAMKNIGFLMMRRKYPQDYKNITFIFHDVDTWPCKKGLVHYNAEHGKVCHFYGYKFALGGMFAIKGADFEKTGGFPNFWGWGIEDNLMNDRCLKANLEINRDCFYSISDRKSIVRPFDGFERIISRRDGIVYRYEQPDDMNSIRGLMAKIDNEFINIYAFSCDMKPDNQEFAKVDIRVTKRLILPKQCFRKVWNMKKIFT